MAVMNFPSIPQGDMTTNPQEWSAYFYRLQESLTYGFSNLDTENYSPSYRDRFLEMQDAAREITDIAGRLQFMASMSALNLLADEADGKTTVFYTGTEPTGAMPGDLWYDTSVSPVIIRRYESDAVGFVSVTDDFLSAALAAAGDAQATADGKINTYYQPDEPKLTAEDVGDIWIKTSDDNKLVRWNGSGWDPIDNGLLANIERDEYGYLVIKSTDGVYKLVNTPTGIIIKQNDEPVFWFADGLLSTPNANIFDQFSMGTDGKGHYDWVMTQGRLSLKYRGPV